MLRSRILASSVLKLKIILINPHTLVAQKIADQRWLIANSAKNKYFFYIKWCD